MIVALLAFLMSAIMITASIVSVRERDSGWWLVGFIPLAVAFFVFGMLGLIDPTLYVNN